MSFIAFAVFCLVLLLAAYTVVRARLRKLNSRELVARMKPLSDHAREVVAMDTQGTVPETWLEFSDMYRAANNLTWLTMLVDQYHRVMSQCTDPDDRADMRLTYVTALREREILIHAMLRVVVQFCFGRIGFGRSNTYMASVAKHYTNLLMLVDEMLELMDGSAAATVGNLFHGS